MKLNDQVKLYSISTKDFLNDSEMKLHKKKQQITFGLSSYKELIDKIIKAKDAEKAVTKFYEDSSWVKLCSENRHPKSHLIYFIHNLIEKSDEDKLINAIKLNDNKAIAQAKSNLFKAAHERKNEIERELDDEAEKVKGARELNPEALKESNKISQFVSALTRTLNLKPNDTTTDLFMIRVYRHNIFESLITNGFTYKNDKYIYFTSSAGAIRDKKTMFIKKKTYDEIANSLFAGLTVESINEQGGMNINKYNAYTALSMTASQPWEPWGDDDRFNIDKCIVVPDFETKVWGIVDKIDSNYNITRDEDGVYTPIPHTDGAGICLPTVSDKAFQFRMPFFKGLLIPIDFKNFIESHYADGIVEDIYGMPHDVIKKGIEVIFTESQFKMHKFYNSWDEYKEAFNTYNCEASIASIEPDIYTDKTLNYQAIQTLTDLSNEEIGDLVSGTNKEIESMGKDLDTMLAALGATDENVNKDSYQEALSIYPALLNDPHGKQTVKDAKKSMVTRARSGKIKLKGSKRTFIAPDVYAFCEWLFLGEKNPKGLLADGEVSCKLYNDNEKVDVIRSPHLYKEHAVRVNKVNAHTETWFTTNCIYTSVHDLISKILVFDVDGDEALIIRGKKFVSAAERNMKGIVPLDYELGVAKSETINPASIYSSLKSAYSKNIGEVSNAITKVWNRGEVNEETLKVVKWLCMESNATIDYAKTLWMPERPKEVQKIMKKYSKSMTPVEIGSNSKKGKVKVKYEQLKLPYFFKFAKDKETEQVEKKSKSTMDRLSAAISNKRIYFNKVVEPVDYKKLMSSPNTSLTSEKAKEIIQLYEELNKTKKIRMKRKAKLQNKSLKRAKNSVVDEIKEELINLTADDELKVTDVLVKYLAEKKSANNDTLWDAFGHVIVFNLKRNILEEYNCFSCGVEMEKTKKVRCYECEKSSKRFKDSVRQKKNREKKKLVTQK